MTTEASTPPRPDPWATTEPREALRDTNAARIVSMTPGMTPSPGGDYPANMVDFCGHDENYVEDVSFTGQKAMVLRSKTQHVHNGGAGGVCEPIGHAAQVRAGGSPLIRHGDSFYMDDRRTVGEASFVRDTACYAAPVDTDPIPGSARTTMSQATGGPEVMSDASPDPSYWRPGATLALAGDENRFTNPPAPQAPSPATSPQAAPPGQQTLPAAPRTQAPSVPSPSGPGNSAGPPQPPPPGQPSGWGRWLQWLNPLREAQSLQQAIDPLTDNYLSKKQIQNLRLGSLEKEVLPQAKTDEERAIIQDGIDRIRREALPSGDLKRADELYDETLARLGEAELRRQSARRDTVQGFKYHLDELGADQDGNVRVTGQRGPDPNNPCLLIPYGLLSCPKAPGPNGPGTGDSTPAHHAVADRAFRATGRDDKPLWDQTDYVSGMSEGAGLAMCLEGESSDRESPHGEATLEYEEITKAASVNGMVRLGIAEAAAASGIEKATAGRCKAPEVQAQLRAYHQAKGMGPDTWVRQQQGTLGPGQVPALGSH